MKEELERIEALDKSMLVPADVAKYLGCSAYTINIATRDGKNPFPFPVIRMGSRVRIPKEPFIKVMRGE
jgi:excisionase family DNA binding protein